MAEAYLNRIETAVPPYDIHQKFTEYAPTLLSDTASQKLFQRMAKRADILHRYSFLPAHTDTGRLDAAGFYEPEDFPSTATRMEFYHRHALQLVVATIDRLELENQCEEITHLIVTSCTGFYAPGLDLEIMAHYGLNPATERSIIGFMGCHAAIHALKAARHIIRSQPDAKVLVINLELCTLHLQQPENLEQLLCFLLFGDGCAASLVSAEPVGVALQQFHAAVLPESDGHITWGIGNSGFEMHLSGQVPRLISEQLPKFLQQAIGHDRDRLQHWAIHPGGRSVLDAVQSATGLEDAQMAPSRQVLAEYGNMSSPTIMFVLQHILNQLQSGDGFAMAFGPGLSVEAMRFAVAGG